MGFTGFLKSQYGHGVESAAKYYGIEQLYFDWLRQAYSYRRMFIQDLYLLAFDCSEIRTPILHLKQEVFRKGFEEWHPNFVVRCEKCDTDFQSLEEAEGHKDHGLRKPDPEQIKDFDKKWKNNSNIFGQSLESILSQAYDDVNIVDDLFIHLNKTYKKVNNKLYGELVEIRRIHPALVEIDLDKNGLPKNSHWLCPFHRDEVSSAPGVCKNSECRTDLIPAMYVYNHRGNRVYLFQDELIHNSKFSPHETYGYSPILTLMQKILTISGMDRFLYRYFFERKTPTQMILTNTDDPQSLEVERNKIESKMMEDPTYTPWIAVSNRTGRGRTDVVKLFHTLQEMDYLNVRNEIRDRIAGMYGVPQMYYNVMEGIGGLSGQTQQLKMMSNVASSDQRIFNENIIPTILKSLGITDWKIILRPPEEKVEGQVLQLAQQKVGIANTMRSMGFDIKLKAGARDIETLDFVFEGKAINIQQQMGGMGGFGGELPVGGLETPQLQQGLGQESQEPNEEIAPPKNRLEEKVYSEPTPEEEEENEENGVEGEVWG